MLTKAKERASTIADAGKEKVAELAGAGKVRAQAAVERAEDKIVDKAIGWTEDKVTEHAGRAVEKAGARIKEGVCSDHQIPHFVATMLCGMIDSVLPDVREEVVYAVMGQVYSRRPAQDELVLASRGGLGRAVGCLRGAVLYHLQPYDNGGGGRITDIWWWVLTLPAVCPLFGVQQVWFLLLFLLIDKGDEYQLCSFILSFKGLQALTVGIVGVIIGAVQYGLCVNKTPPTCESDAPGMSPWFFLELSAFSGQIVLVWTAFMLLPCSDKKGADARVQGAVARAAAAADDAEAAEAAEAAVGSGSGSGFCCCCCCCRLSKDRGGRLKYWLTFDTLIFLLAAGLVGITVAVKGAAVLEADWKFRQLLYWSKVMYGLLSTPYLLFSLPLATRLITHARPTGYDKRGRLRPCKARAGAAVQNNKEEEEKKP